MKKGRQDRIEETLTFKTIRELHKFDINKCNRRYCNGDFVNEKQHNIQWVEVLSKEALQD